MLSQKPRAHDGWVVALIMATLVHCSAGTAAAKRPPRGSIAFGAPEPPSLSQAADLSRLGSVFAEIAERVVPVVVSVVPTKIDTVEFHRNPFYRFFDGLDPFGFPGRREDPPVERRERRQEGLGSGVIVSSAGHILTNFHVVSGADEIEVRLHDNRVFDATIVGSDSLSDVAVLKLTESVPDLPVAYLGNSDSIRPGDWVLAVGNPFSLSQTVTAGIVSAVGRSVTSTNRYENYIQTDAAINPGNSGGALVNTRGELIGINTMIFTQSGGFMGIGFAIPINMARRAMEDLVYEGRVIRGWFGVSIQELSPAMRKGLDIPGGQTGALVADVFDDQPADRAGMRRGDVIITINGHSVQSTNELRNIVATLQPGQQVRVVVLRDGKRKTLRVVVGER